MANATEDDKEDKTSADASQQKKESDEKKPDDQGDQADDQNDDQGDEGIDYAAELEKVQDQLKQAEYTIVDLRQKKGGKKENESQSTDEDVVDKKIDERMSSIQQQLASTAIASALGSLSDDADERKLILFHYNNSIKTTGITPEAILSDLENAKTLANKRKILRENAEIKRTIITKNSMGSGGRGSNQDKKEAEQPTVKVSDAEAALLARRGLKPSDVKVNTTTAARR